MSPAGKTPRPPQRSTGGQRSKLDAPLLPQLESQKSLPQRMQPCGDSQDNHSLFAVGTSTLQYWKWYLLPLPQSMSLQCIEKAICSGTSGTALRVLHQGIRLRITISDNAPWSHCSHFKVVVLLRDHFITNYKMRYPRQTFIKQMAY